MAHTDHFQTAAMACTTLLAGLTLIACEGEPPKPAETTSNAASVTALTEPAVTASATVVATADEPEQEDPAQNIECQQGPLADFHDDTLEQEVRRKLQKPEGGIKVTELRGIKSINLARDPDSKVDYLDPCIFPHLTGVKDLFLGAGRLRDISALAKLTQLESLRVSMNQVSDLTPLSGLKKLDRLDLGHTQVVDVSPLAKLTTLTELQLDNTRVKDVSPLASLTSLERLSLQRTDVEDISPLKPLTKLKFLYLAGSRVEDPYALARPGLKVIQD